MDVKRDHERFGQAGAQVAAVMMGTPQQAAAFSTRFGLTFPVLADPQREAYQAFRLPRGSLGQIAGPRTWLKGLLALFRGGAGLPQGDPWQMPGAFVIDRAGILRLVHYPAHTADHISHDRIIDALKSIRPIA